MPGQTLFFVHATDDVLEQVRDPLMSQGWELTLLPADAPDLNSAFAEKLPVAAAWCLDGEVSGEVSVAAAGVLADDRIVRPLMIFIGGSSEAIELARAAVPYGVFVSAAELPWVLKRMVYKD